MADQPTGLVVAAHGRHCLVESPDGSRRICHPRGKKNAVVVGDRVRWQVSGDEGSIEQVLEEIHRLPYCPDSLAALERYINRPLAAG